MFRSKVLASLGLSVLTCLPAGGQGELPAALRPMRERIRELAASGRVVSVSVGVQRGAQLLWEESFGWADAARRLPATPDTPYPLASLTKSMTATLALRLAQEGVVELDAPLARLLGDDAVRVYEGDPDDLTLRNVLAMKAGVPQGWRTYAAEVEPLPTTADTLRATSVVTFAPGQAFLYSNLAYGLAQVALERAAGAPLATLFEEHLFAPLGMTGAHARAPRAADAKQHDASGVPQAPSVFLPTAAAGASASLRDLLRYGRFHLGALPGTSAFLTPGWFGILHPDPSRGDPGYMGFGQIDLGDGLQWILSNGYFSGGCTSMLTLVPGHELVVVVLVNSDAGSSLADELAIDLADSLVPGFAARARAEMARWEELERSEPFRARPDLLGVWQGRIALEAREVPITLTFEDDDSIFLTWDDAHEALLSDVRQRGDRLLASFRAALPFEEAEGEAVEIQLDLETDVQRLHGAAIARFGTERGSFLLPAHVALTRVK